MTTKSELKEDLINLTKDFVKDPQLSRSFSYSNGNDGEIVDSVLSRDAEWNLQSSGKVWGRPESVWAEYLFTWNPLLAEIEAMEACQWLKEAGFPQYAQAYKEGRFPIDLEMAKSDHGFLDDDAMEAVIRRLKLLNKCTSNKQLLVAAVAADNPEKQQQQLEQLEKIQQQCLKTKESDGDDDDDDLCCSALSDSWTYKRNSGQWCRQESAPWQTSGKNYLRQQMNSTSVDSTHLESSHCKATLKTITPIRTTIVAGSSVSNTTVGGEVANKKDSVIAVSSPLSSQNNNAITFLQKSCNGQENKSREGILNSAESVTVDSIFSSKPFSNCKTDAKELDKQKTCSAGMSTVNESYEKENFCRQNNSVGREFSRNNKVVTALSNKTDFVSVPSTSSSNKSFQDALFASKNDKRDQDMSKNRGELLARDFGNSLDELERLIQSEFLSVSQSNEKISTDVAHVSGGTTEVSPSKQANHVRSKSATVVTSVSRKVSESLPVISGCKTSPCDVESKISSSHMQQEKALPSPLVDQPFQRNTSITGSGRIRLALMRKMELLSGKKKKNGAQLKAEDIGEPTVMESEKLKEKLESLGCVDLTPSPSSSIEVEEKVKSFQFDSSTPTSSQSNKSSQKGPNHANLGTSSVTPTPSLEKLDEVLERLRICEESIGKESTGSGRSTLGLGESSPLEQDDNKTYFNRAFDNIYRSSKKYNETDRAGMMSLITPNAIIKSANSESLRGSKGVDQCLRRKGVTTSFSSSVLSDVNTEKFNFNVVSDCGSSNFTSDNLIIRSEISNSNKSKEVVTNVNLGHNDNFLCNNSSYSGTANFPKGIIMSSFQEKHPFAMPSSQPVRESCCANPTAELDSILDDLYRNIDSLNSIRSKSLEPEGSAAYREIYGDTSSISGSLKKTKLMATKSVDASPSAASGFRLDDKSIRFQGCLRKPNIFNLECSQFARENVPALSKAEIIANKDCMALSLSQNATAISVSNSGITDSPMRSTKLSTDKTLPCHINKSIEQTRLLVSTADDENGKSSAYSTISKDSLKFSISSKSRNLDDERDSLTEKSGGTTSHDEDSQEGLESPVWDFPQQLTPDAGEIKDNWTYADDHNFSERRDSGIGSPQTKGRRHQRRARIRWHSFACSHRVSVSSQSRQISSLSTGQLVVLKKLSLLKLTAALEKYSDIQLSSKNWLLPLQTKKSLRLSDTAAHSKRVFGLPLTVVQQRHGQPLPECILLAMRHLRRTAQSCEGIFRKSGVKSRVQGLRDSVEANPDMMNFSDHSPYDVADLLKLYFRELPDCLLTNKLSSAFIAIFQSNIPDDVRIDLLTAGVLLMPDEHRESLACLLLFLNDMATHSQHNQMNASNLAICFAPAIFNLYALKGSRQGITSMHSRKGRNRSLSPGSGGSLKGRRSEGLPGEKDLAEQKAAHLCLTSLITHAKSVFMVSEEMIGGFRLTYIEQGDPVSLSELTSRHNGNITSYMDSCIHGLLKESRDKFKGWVSATNSALNDPTTDVELKYKKVGDGHPLRLWKWQVEVAAGPLQVLNRVLRERHLWDPDFMRWRTVVTLDSHTEVFQYSVGTMVPHPPRDFCELRSWRTDQPGGACVLVSTSVEHPDARLGEGAVRGVILASRYLIEPCAPAPGSSVQRSRLTHISRIDLRGHSLEWYNSVYSHLCANQALAIRDSFLNNHTPANEGPETVV